MKKNGQYVGVDEKYIPEEEKYVDNSANEEIKDSINDGMRSIKNYVTDKDNQEKFKKVGKKGLKIAKGIGIGYLTSVAIIFILFISVFIFVLVNFFKINNQADEQFNKVNEYSESIIDKITDQATEQKNENQYSQMEIQMFNSPFELYHGTKSGFFLKDLLEKVIANNKTQKEHLITVVYNQTTTSKTDEITSLKHTLEDNKQYEVSLDYDTNGFVNKITIIAL